MTNGTPLCASPCGATCRAEVAAACSPPSRPSQARGPRDSVADHAAGCLGSACFWTSNIVVEPLPLRLSRRRTCVALPPWFVVRDRLQAMDRHLDRVGQAMERGRRNVVFANACRPPRRDGPAGRGSGHLPCCSSASLALRRCTRPGLLGRGVVARPARGRFCRRAGPPRLGRPGRHEARAAAGTPACSSTRAIAARASSAAYGSRHTSATRGSTRISSCRTAGRELVRHLRRRARPGEATRARCRDRVAARASHAPALGGQRRGWRRLGPPWNAKASDLGWRPHVDVGVSDEALRSAPRARWPCSSAPAGAVRPGPARGRGQWNPRRRPRGGWCARVGHRRSDRHSVRRRRRARPGVEPHVLGRGPSGPAGPAAAASTSADSGPGQSGRRLDARSAGPRRAEDRVIIARTAEPLRQDQRRHGRACPRGRGSCGSACSSVLSADPSARRPRRPCGSVRSLGSDSPLQSPWRHSRTSACAPQPRDGGSARGRDDVRSLERELARCLTVSTSTAVGLGALALAATPKIVDLVLPRPPVGLDRSQAGSLFAGLVVLSVVALVTQTFAAVLPGVQRGDRENLAWTAGSAPTSSSSCPAWRSD